jgi:alpha-L-fucosidase
MDWFNNANLGVFLHWGIYSVPAFDNTMCAKKRTIMNGSEWYMGRLTKTFRESYSDKLTKEYHKKNYGDMPYSDFTKSFIGKNFNADNWCKMFKEAGAKYIVITAKHHDGFCLWPTKTSQFNIKNTPLKQDVIGELKKSADKYELKFGIYFSWMEFDKSITKEFVTKIIKPQIAELIKYKPDLFWFDGDWQTTSEKLDAANIIRVLHKNGCIVNSRLGKGDLVGDYNNFSDRFIAAEKHEKRYESCHTIGLSWGYNKEQQENDYKTSDELVKIYKNVTSTNGNLLLNLGPDADGNFDKIEKERFIEFGKKINLL